MSDDSMAERGSGTVAVLAVCLLLLLGFAVLGAFGQVVVARSRAASAADLVALSAAAPDPAAPGSCLGRQRSAASLAATLNQVRLQGCEVLDDGSVQVEVTVTLVGPLARFPPATAQARAGRPWSGPSQEGLSQTGRLPGP